MITDCFGAQAWDLSDTEAIFLQGTFSLLKVMIPAAIWLFTWRLCKTEREENERGVSILGLNVTYESRYATSRKFPLPLCITTTVLTFLLGVLLTEGYRMLS